MPNKDQISSDTFSTLSDRAFSIVIMNLDFQHINCCFHVEVTKVDGFYHIT